MENSSCNTSPELSSSVSPLGTMAVSPCPAASRDVPPRPAVSQSVEKCKTNPKPPILTGQQLAAARLVAEGLPTKVVAGELGTSTRTVNRWKQQGAFQNEVRGIHELIAIQSAKGRIHVRSPERLFSGRAPHRGFGPPVAIRSAASYPARTAIDRPVSKSIEQEDREVEAMIAEILGEKAGRQRGT